MRFSLIDRVVERDGRRIVADKAVTTAEEYLSDHFPGFPVLPGVLMIEAMVQAARLVAEADSGPRLVLGSVRALKYGAFVRPGETLRVTVELAAADPASGHIGCKGRGERIGGEPGGAPAGPLAVSGRFTLRPQAG